MALVDETLDIPKEAESLESVPAGDLSHPGETRPREANDLNNAHGFEGVRSLASSTTTAAEASIPSSVWSSLRTALDAGRQGPERTIENALALRRNASPQESASQDVRAWVGATRELQKQVTAAVANQLSGALAKK